MIFIFKEKIEFDGEKYRAPMFDLGLHYIYSNIKELKVLETKKGDELSNISFLCTPYDSILELFLPKPKGYIRFEAITL